MKSQYKTQKSLRLFSYSPINLIQDEENLSTKARIQKTSRSLVKKLFEPISRSPLSRLNRKLSKISLIKPNLQNKKIYFNHTTSHHQIEENLQKIIKLPKLPYGKHKSYNEETNFVSNHFINQNDPVSDEKAAEVKKVIKIFKNKSRYKAKINAKSFRNSLKLVNTNKTSFEEFTNEGGKLIVENNSSAYFYYNKQKREYSVSSNYSEEKPKFYNLHKKPFSKNSILSVKIIQDEEKFLNLPFAFNCEFKPINK